MYEKTNIPGFMKDTKSGIVINTNDDEYVRVLAAREKRKKEENTISRVDQMSKEVDLIKNKLENIETLLKKALKLD